MQTQSTKNFSGLKNHILNGINVVQKNAINNLLNYYNFIEENHSTELPKEEIEDLKKAYIERINQLFPQQGIELSQKKYPQTG